MYYEIPQMARDRRHAASQRYWRGVRNKLRMSFGYRFNALLFMFTFVLVIWPVLKVYGFLDRVPGWVSVAALLGLTAFIGKISMV